MSDQITMNHCTAVHAAILMGEISEDEPISDTLMAPFIAAVKANGIDAALEAIKAKAQEAFSNACGACPNEIEAKLEKVMSAVSAGFTARELH